MQIDTPARKEIERLAIIISRRSDLLLLCWCAPKACHGDVVKEFVERIVRHNTGKKFPTA
jgi:hypothetical protein